MKTPPLTRLIFAAAAVASLALAAPAAGDGGRANDGPVATAVAPHHGKVVLRRDGSKAVPFDSATRPADEPALRRDGSKAEPFIAEVDQKAGVANEGFNWGDAMVGAGGAFGLMLLTSGALVLVRHRSAGAHSAQA